MWVVDADHRLAESLGGPVARAFGCADKVAVLADGELLRLGTPPEVVAAERCTPDTGWMSPCCRGWTVLIAPRCRASYLS
jgi:hypothetical protein